MTSKRLSAKARYFIVLLICVMMSASLSCKKVLDVETTHASAEELQWKTIADSRSALFGLYGLFRSALAENNGHWVYGEMRYGDFKAYDRVDLKSISENKLTASYPVLQQLSDWRRFYAIINAASVLIENAPKVLKADRRYSEQFLKYDIAQARAIRAFAYFYMARIWGSVPLITAAYDNGSFLEFPLSSEIEVLDFAEKELLSASLDLPYLYAVSPQTYYDLNQSNLGGALLNKVSAYAILSHIAAWRGNYVNAEAYTAFVLNNYTKANVTKSTVTVLTSPGGLFSKRSSAQLVSFGFMDSNKESTRTGHIESLTLAAPFVERLLPDIYVPKDSIFKIFTYAYDSRFGIDTLSNRYTTNYFTNLNGEVPIFSKVKVVRDGATANQFDIFGSVILFSRIEDIMLLRAETLLAIGRTDEAMSLLNLFNDDRALPKYVRKDTDKLADLYELVFAERRRELMGEGWRWYDQVRYQKLVQKNTAFTTLIANKGIYWPISDLALSSNSKLQQNPFWK